jgi:hypothetical protein
MSAAAAAFAEAMAAPFPRSRRVLPEQGEAGRRGRPSAFLGATLVAAPPGPRKGSVCLAPASRSASPAAEPAAFRPPRRRAILAGMSTRPRSPAGEPMTRGNMRSNDVARSMCRAGCATTGRSRAPIAGPMTCRYRRSARAWCALWSDSPRLGTHHHDGRLEHRIIHSDCDRTASTERPSGSAPSR